MMQTANGKDADICEPGDHLPEGHLTPVRHRQTVLQNITLATLKAKGVDKGAAKQTAPRTSKKSRSRGKSGQLSRRIIRRTKTACRHCLGSLHGTKGHANQKTYLCP